MIPLVILGVGIFLVIASKAGAMQISKLATAYVNGMPQEIQISSIGNGLFLRSDAAHAWLLMREAAEKENIFIVVDGPNAAFRTSTQQAQVLAERGSYGSGGYAAKIGFSPHQRGDAIDISHVNPWSGAQYMPEVRAWLLTNGPKFGWHNIGNQFKTPEPWHFEYRSTT